MRKRHWITTVFAFLLTVLFTSPMWADNYYVVKPGEWLSTIAQKVYGDGNKWPQISKANKLQNPNKLLVGQRLVIPNAPPQMAGSVSPTEPSANGTVEPFTFQKFAFLYFNDFHGALEPRTKKKKVNGKKVKYEVNGIARMATMVKKLRAANRQYNIPTYLVNAGDFIQGSLLSNSSKGAIEAEVFNRMGLSFYTMGNHELDFGQDNLLNLRRLIKAPCVTANYKIRNKPVGKVLIKKVNGIKMGVAGLVASQDFSLAMPKVDPIFLKNSSVEDEFKKAKEIVSYFKKKGVDLVVFVNHLGLENDKKLAKEVEGIDIIIGGDSHTAIEGCEMVKNKNNKTCIVQAGAEGQYLGHLEVTLWEGKLSSFDAKLIPLDETVTPDPGISRYIQSKKSELKRQYGKIIAQNDCSLEGTKHTIREQETNLGDFVTDILKDHFRVDVAIYNSGGIRASLAKGPVTIGDIMAALPFPTNRTHLLKLTGKELMTVLNYNATQVGKGGFLQVSGISFILDPNIGVQQVEIDGMPLDPDQMYTVVTNSYVATGGDGYKMLEKVPEDRREYESNPTPIVINYIEKHYGANKHISYCGSKGRITLVE